ncbi:MAG TPA: hypothetical protein VKW06_01230 [Candidatus Angelobacter sp.]|nr:hypothetical protein [Candidatus Angelobacter sp.]
MGAALIQLQDFHSILGAAGRSPEIAESADLYGWLVGSWNLDVLHYKAVDVSGRGLKGEVHAGWVLEGRAVQDVWIMPQRAERNDKTGKDNNMYGTTLRIWSPALQAWLIRWINPVSGHLEEQTGRRSGRDIVQIGARADGTPTRWRFTEITPDSFHWMGESLNPDGHTWKMEGEFRARRVRS